MLVFAIKGNVINYIITITSMNICIYVIIEITFIAHALLYILPDLLRWLLPLSLLIIYILLPLYHFFNHVFCITKQALQATIPIVAM